jgi:hypothetical protein
MARRFARVKGVALGFPVIATLLAGCVVVPPGVPGRTESSTPGATALPAPPDAADRSADVILPGVTGEETATRLLTASLLQSELLAFADRYLEAVAEATDWGADHVPDAKARAAFRQTKVVYVTAAVTTVTEPDPLRVLRDLLVMLRLQRMVWEEADISWAGPEATARMQETLATLETQLVTLARRVFPAEAIEIVHELTAEWRAANPERRYIAFVRFHDLGDSELRHRFEQHVSSGGLLAPVAEASQEIHEIRRVAERAVFLANHMPMLVEWQAEGLIYHALRLPETQGLLGDIDRFAGTAEDVAGQLATLPERVASERQALLENLARLLHDQRTATIEELARTIRAEREGAFQAINASAGRLLPLAEQLAATATGMRETMTLIAELRGDASDEPSELSLDEVAAVVERMILLTSETSGLLRSVQSLVSADRSTRGLDRIDEILKAHEMRLFVLAASLILMFGVMVLVVLFVWRRTRPVGGVDT